MKSFDSTTQPLLGIHSIEASAGTGKTYSITLLWLRLIIEHSLLIEQILVSTFTTAATAELKERLLLSLRAALRSAQALQQTQNHDSTPIFTIVKRRVDSGAETVDSLVQRLARAVSSFDLAPISTLHGFCQSLITRHALEIGCDSGLRIVSECDDLLHQIIDDQLMLMADEVPPIEPERLREVASIAARIAGAELLATPACLREDIEALRGQILAAVPGVLGRVQAATQRTNLTKKFAAFASDPETVPKTLAPGELRELEKCDAPFITLWNSLTTLQDLLTGIPRSQIAANVTSLFPQSKLSAGIRGFEDILLTVQDALRSQGPDGSLAQAARKRLKAAIIDECQDSDGVQIEVFEQLFRHRDTLSFLVIGDPKQSIYRFRGADLASYKTLASRAEPAPVMTTNYRSDPALVQTLNALYSHRSEFPDGLNPGLPTQYVAVSAAATEARIFDSKDLPSLVFQWTDATNRGRAKLGIAEQVAAECARLLREDIQIEDRHSRTRRPIRAGDIAVLAASRNELQLIRRHLTQVNIACQSSGKGLGSVFGSDEAQDILAWLTLLTTLQGRGDVLQRLFAFLGTPLGGFSPLALQNLREDAGHQASLCATFQKVALDVVRSGPLPVLLQHLGQQSVIDANLAYADGERRYTNWQQIASLLQHEHGRGRRGVDALTLWLARQTAAKPESLSDEEDSEESALMKLETDADAVQLVTIHGSKGLEYPVVFCPFLWHVRSLQTRNQSPVGRVRLHKGWIVDVGSPDFETHRTTGLRQEDEEDHRKLYVALTRARHRLYIGIAPIAPGKRGNHQNGAAQSALAHLLQLESLPPEEWRDALTGIEGTTLLDSASSERPSTSAQTTALAPAATLRIPPPIPPYLHSFQRTASFSGLSKSDQEHVAPTDRDEDQAGPESTAPVPSDLLQPLGDAGAALGDQLHRVLEEYLGNRKELTDAVADTKNPELWIPAIDAILDTPLALSGTEPARLRALRDGCITEMQFHLPVASLSPERLAATLLRTDSIATSEDRRMWAKRLAQWGFGEFGGFLQGFIDLIFEHEGRWFVADYKSNRLNGYTAAILEAAMLDKHYLLQGLFYALALHRHLQVQLPGYHYEKHFGGVAYLFVRGFPHQGLWFERPTASTLDNLGSLFQPLPR